MWTTKGILKGLRLATASSEFRYQLICTAPDVSETAAIGSTVQPPEKEIRSMVRSLKGQVLQVIVLSGRDADVQLIEGISRMLKSQAALVEDYYEGRYIVGAYQAQKSTRALMH